MIDVAETIARFNAGRDPERLAMKYKAMRTSPFVFLRGTCHLFYERLPRAAVLDDAPPVWICGDMHLENFGSYKADNGLVYFDNNDFDEACLAPNLAELARLLTSVLAGAADLKLSRAQALALCHTAVEAYGAALAFGKARWVERETSSGMVRDLFDALASRTRAAHLDRRTTLKGKTRTLKVDGRKALPVSDERRAAVTQFMQQFAAGESDPDFYRVLDVARRIAGTGSLGVDRYVILVEGKGSPDGNYLLDLKEALRMANRSGARRRDSAAKSGGFAGVFARGGLQSALVCAAQPAAFGRPRRVAGLGRQTAEARGSGRQHGRVERMGAFAQRRPAEVVHCR